MTCPPDEGDAPTIEFLLSSVETLREHVELLHAKCGALELYNLSLLALLSELQITDALETKNTILKLVRIGQANDPENIALGAAISELERMLKHKSGEIISFPSRPS